MSENTTTSTPQEDTRDQQPAPAHEEHPPREQKPNNSSPPPPDDEPTHSPTQKPDDTPLNKNDSQEDPANLDKSAKPATAGEADEPKIGHGPGMYDDGLPHYFDVDWDVFREMVERRDNDILREHFGGVKGFEVAFKTNLLNGIDSATAQFRVDQFGENLLKKKEPVTFLEFLWEAFQDQIVIILCVAATISIIFGMTLPNPHSGEVEPEHGWIEGVAILISVLLVTMTGSINNYQKAKKFEEMERAQAIKELSVTRDGKEITIDSNLLTVGDILTLETGMELSCDAVFVSGSDLKINESALTGEPDLINKNEEEALFISGTSVEEGNGKVLVLAIGMGSFQGALKSQLDVESEETPLQEHLGELADDIGKFGLGGALLLLVALTIKEVILITTQDKAANAASFLNFFLIAITLIAVAIPEGLPLAVTISLAFSMSAMMKDNCMVRVLASCETMGAATAICSDKTGTLTTNMMTVVQGCIVGCEFIINGYALVARHDKVELCSKEGDGNNVKLSPPESVRTDLLDKFSYALSVNCTAREVEQDGILKWVGNKTEHGLLKWVKGVGRDYAQMKNSIAHEDIRQYPFSSEKKRMTTLVRDRSKDNVVTAYTKGASEAILEGADSWMDASGLVQQMTEQKRREFEDIILNMANEGNRTIGVAFAPCEFDQFPAEEPDFRSTFLGILGIQDPVRSNVPQAVLDAESAGLVVRMVTGDNINTAMAIGKKCNIFRDNGFDIALTGPEFRAMEKDNREELIKILPRIRVLARSSPNDKHILVGLLQDEQGEVVGVTGDGTNDAPALKLADVGFAMNTGTDIARDASDMILLDDNFATVVTAIKWGRAVNDNIKKFLQFQLAINCAGVSLTLVGSLASSTSKEPFTPVQLLWLNLIMDTLAAIALSTELPEDACITRPPVFKQAPLITNRMKVFIGFHGLYQFIMIILVMFLGHDWFVTIENKAKCQTRFPDNSDDELSCKRACTNEGGVFYADTRTCQQGRVHSTMIFNIFIWFQIFNVINARKIYGEKNPFEGIVTRSQNLMLVFGIILALQVIAVELFGDFMGTTGLKWDHWLICVGLGATEWIIGIFQRLIPVSDHVPDFVERKEAKLKELRESLETEHKSRLELHKNDTVARRSSIRVTKARRGSNH